MSRYILVSLISLFISFNSFSQCTPLPQFADSAFGVWPDTIQNFPHAYLDQYYETIVYIKAPNNTSELGVAWAITIDSLLIESITGLPNNIGYSCDNARCKWNGGGNGCIKLSGIPTQTGTFPLELNARGYGAGGTINAPYTFSGYELVVEEQVGIAENNNQFLVFQNKPNPYRGSTKIEYQNNTPQNVSLIVYNLLGEEVYSKQHFALTGLNWFELNDELTPGYYIYYLNVAGRMYLGNKMIVVSK